MKCSLRLIEDRLAPQNELAFLPAVARAVLVLEGGVTIETATATTLQAPRSAWVGDEAISYLAGAQGARLLRWELVGESDALDGRLRSAPKATSEVKLVSPVDLDDRHGWLLRCDEVSFPKGTVAPLHVHQGPGTRFVISGRIDHRDQNGHENSYPAGQPFHEDGIDAPVLARMSGDEETVFVRGLLLPRALKSRGSTRFVEPETWARPPTYQRYVVFAERFVELPR